MTKDQKELILNIIAVRLDNVKDVTRRSRLAFLITTIASCAIIVTIWGVYFSTARNVALYLPNESQKQIGGENDVQKLVKEEIKSPILPLHENNRRELVKEWIRTTSVSIDLLGVEINVNDFPFIGSIGLFIVCFWLFFTFRRENRAIVSLLRDVKNELNFPRPNQKKGDDIWDIANLAFHGVANSLIFFTTGTHDQPLSQVDIFGGKQSVIQGIFDRFIDILTKIIRKLVMLLIFLPAITTGIIIWADEHSSEHIPSPFRAINGVNVTPNELAKFYNLSSDQISYENTAGKLAGILTLFICIACFIFQKRTSDSLKAFENRLKKESSVKDTNEDIPKVPDNNEKKSDESSNNIEIP